MFWWAKSLLISAAPSPAGYPCPKPVLDLALSLNSSYVLPCSDPFSSGCPNLGGQGVHINLHLFALPLQICFSGILIAAPDFLLFKFFFPVSPQCHHPTSPCLRGSPETKEGGFHPFPCLKLNSLSITACNPTFSSALHWILVSFLPIPFPIFIPRSYSACPWISSTSLSSWHGLLFIPKLLILTYSLCPPKHCQHFSGFWSNLSVFPTEEGQQQKHGVFVEESFPASSQETPAAAGRLDSAPADAPETSTDGSCGIRIHRSHCWERARSHFSKACKFAKCRQFLSGIAQSSSLTEELDSTSFSARLPRLGSSY